MQAHPTTRGATSMRFIVMHKVTPSIARGERPSQAIIDGMGSLIQESLKSGAFLDGAGLKPSGTRIRLTFSGGACEVNRGPYAGAHELVAGFMHLKVKTTDEAVAWAKRLGQVLGDVELELGEVTEPWDLGMAPKPTGEVPIRFLLLNKATPRTEAGTPPSARELAEMGALLEEMKKAGVLQGAEGLQPSAKGLRLVHAGAKRTITDGPFAESKELISGFSVIRVASREEALAWATRYATILGDIEVDVLPLYEPADLARG